MVVVLKIRNGSHLVESTFDTIPNYCSLLVAIGKLLQLQSGFVLKYTDDEGDLCTLVEPTFEDFLTSEQEPAQGKTVLSLEVHAAPALLQPQQQKAPDLPRNYGKRGKGCGTGSGAQEPEDSWTADERDLEELLQQFEDPAPSKPKKKKRKGRSRAMSNQADAASVCEDGSTEKFDDAVATEMSKQGRSSLTAWEETTHDEAEMGLLENETDGEVSWHEDVEADDGHEGDDLTSVPAQRSFQPLRSSSCPCFATWQADDGERAESLVARVWPFVDPEKVAVTFPDEMELQSTQKISQPSLEATQQLAVPQQEGPSRSYQQVVWMPVLMNFVTST